MYKYGFLLFLIAVLLFAILAPVAIVYTIAKYLYRSYSFRSFYRLFRSYFRALAFTIDQSGNATCKELFNDVLIKEGGFSFGSPDNSISAVLGRNKIDKTLAPAGVALSAFLNWLDKEHVEKAAKIEGLL